MNILIVEDNTNDRKLLRYTLERHGCTVIEARDGEEGLDLAFHHLPDIIISDAIMPRMDGFQLLRALKADSVSQIDPLPFLLRHLHLRAGRTTCPLSWSGCIRGQAGGAGRALGEDLRDQESMGSAA